MFDVDLKSLTKYLLEGLAVAAATYLIPRLRTTPLETFLIALTAAAVFAVLDTFAPKVAAGTRQGAGFSMGFGLVGGGSTGDSADADAESVSDETASTTSDVSE